MEVIKRKIYCFYYILIVYVVGAYYVLLQWIQKHVRPSGLSKKTNLVALITGGGRGIGYETALQLLKQDVTVIIAGIYEQQKEGLKKLKEIYEEKVKFLHCDLSSLHSVRMLVKDFEKLNLPLHILINNAGVMFTPYKETDEGHESHWGINYLSHFLLTHLLLPHLLSSGSSSHPSRIVNLASCLHFPGTINFNDIEGKTCYSAEAAYCQSKLAAVIFAKKLSRELESANAHVLINSVHPAVAFTDLYRHIWWAGIPAGLAYLFLKTPSAASDTVIYATLSSDVVTGGNYFENCKPVKASQEACCKRVQDSLWELSMSQLLIKEFGRI